MKRIMQISFGLVAAHSLSPLAGRGWGEGAYPPGAELRRSESRRGPLTLASLDLSPRSGER